MAKRKFTKNGEKPSKYRCTKCKWEGKRDEKFIAEIEGKDFYELICPKCGNNEFYGLLPVEEK